MKKPGLILLTVLVWFSFSWETPATPPTAAAERFAVGQTVTFGRYEQDNDRSNGKEEIEWLVLERAEDKALVISKYLLEYQPFNRLNQRITWEECSLREWLNTKFRRDAFTQEELANILIGDVRAEKHPDYQTNPGADTRDWIFLLSANEVSLYFGKSGGQMTKATRYARSRGAYIGENGHSWWWLRTPGYHPYFAAGVNTVGEFFNFRACNPEGGIRPAMWLDLSGGTD